MRPDDSSLPRNRWCLAPPGVVIVVHLIVFVMVVVAVMGLVTAGHDQGQAMTLISWAGMTSAVITGGMLRTRRRNA